MLFVLKHSLCSNSIGSISGLGFDSL
jgi:hypothetical protein